MEKYIFNGLAELARDFWDYSPEDYKLLENEFTNAPILFGGEDDLYYDNFGNELKVEQLPRAGYDEVVTHTICGQQIKAMCVLDEGFCGWVFLAKDYDTLKKAGFNTFCINK